MREVIEEVFTAVLDYLIGHRYVRFVWRKSSENYKQKFQAKVHEMMDEVELVNKEEDERYGDKDLEELG